MIGPALAREVLQAALASGGSSAELFVEERISASVSLDGGRIEDAQGGVDLGVGLSVTDGDQVVFANGNRVDREGVLGLAGRIAAAVGRQRESAAEEMSPSIQGLVSPVAIPPAEVDISRKIAAVRRAEDAARGRDPRVSQVTCLYRDGDQRIWVADSDGRYVVDRRVHVSLDVTAVARERDRICTGHESISETRGFEIFDLDPPERVGSEAARQAVLQLSALPAPSGSFTVVLSSKAGGTMIHEACGHGLEADFIEKHTSVYAAMLGRKVASELITVVDDGTLPNRRGSSSIDDEGTPSSRVTLIEKGVLKGFLHSRRTALKSGADPTGNGRRESYRHLPIPRMRNTMILPGGASPESILAGVSDGILVCRMGGGEVDVATGNFVFSCSEAYRIREGRIAEPIREATLVGNGPEVLAAIDAVGTDLGFGVGTCGKEGQEVPVSDAQPTLRIPRIVVGGVGAPGVGRD